jgi:hypothetical protein
MKKLKKIVLTEPIFRDIELSSTEKIILGIIGMFIGGCPLTNPEFIEYCGLKNNITVSMSLRRLEKKGKLKIRGDYRKRLIYLI